MFTDGLEQADGTLIYNVNDAFCPTSAVPC